jgi:hypothetical protein
VAGFRLLHLTSQPKGPLPMTNFQNEILAAAKALGNYTLECEFDTLLDEAPESEWFQEHKDGDDSYNRFRKWVRGYMYFNALVCACENAEELDTQLREDYSEILENCV